MLRSLLNRVRALSDSLESGSAVRDVLLNHESDILELQKLQLFRGLKSNGDDMRPYYSEDLKPSGYFHSVESAGRYAAWKRDGISYPYSVDRNPDAPNLFINGRFHDELGVEFGADAVGVMGVTDYAKRIVAKYGINSFGLMPEYWNAIFADRGALNELMNELKSKLYV